MQDKVPIWEKYALTIAEAAIYFRIGENKLRQIVAENLEAEYVINVGNRKLIKRKLFEEYLNKTSQV